MSISVGSKEWYELVNKNYPFPCKVAFLLIKENENDVSICSVKVNSSAKVENVKYGSISKGTWTSEGAALLSITELNNADEYLMEFERLKKMWGFAVIKKVESKIS